MSKEDFPKEYLVGLVANHKRKVEETLQDPSGQLLMYSGALLNWEGEFINNEGVSWKLETVPLEKIVMTGTSPEWNNIILEKAERDPMKLRKLFEDENVRNVFRGSKFTDDPILIREDEEGKYKVLDGMNRVIAAARDRVDQVKAYVGRSIEKSKTEVEPHVVYDFIRAYQQRGGNEEDLKGGLRFLVDAYTNVRVLLRTRLGPEWIKDEKIQKIIKEVLGE